jgi:hypothetical protein
MNATSGDAETPIKQAFPNHPESKIPSSFKYIELVGSYYDPGYGTITFREEIDPENPEERLLVADRPEMTWKYRVRLHHAFADYWAGTFTTPWNPTVLNQCFPCEFKRGVNGKVAALEIEWAGRMGGLNEGKSTFKKVIDKETEI